MYFFPFIIQKFNLKWKTNRHILYLPEDRKYGSRSIFFESLSRQFRKKHLLPKIDKEFTFLKGSSWSKLRNIYLTEDRKGIIFCTSWSVFFETLLRHLCTFYIFQKIENDLLEVSSLNHIQDTSAKNIYSRRKTYIHFSKALLSRNLKDLLDRRQKGDYFLYFLKYLFWNSFKTLTQETFISVQRQRISRTFLGRN